MTKANTTRGGRKNRRATRFIDTLRLADDTAFLADRLMNIYPGPGDMDMDTARAIFEATSELVTAAKRGTVKTGKAVRELMERTVGYASDASDEISLTYLYGESPTVAQTYDGPLILGVMGIVAPWVVKALGFPDEVDGTVPGECRDHS